MSFSDDFPMEGYTYAEPIFDGGIPAQEGYEIDGKPLSDYGVFILDGSNTEIIKMPSVKKNLLIDIPSQSGVTYDGQEVVFSKRMLHSNAGCVAGMWKICGAILTHWCMT